MEKTSEEISKVENENLLYAGPIAGYRYYHGELWEPWINPGDKLELIAEPENPFDANAVAVFWDTERLGYIPQANNQEIANKLASGQKLVVEVIQLDFDAPPQDRLSVKVY